MSTIRLIELAEQALPARPRIPEQRRRPLWSEARETRTFGPVSWYAVGPDVARMEVDLSTGASGLELILAREGAMLDMNAFGYIEREKRPTYEGDTFEVWMSTTATARRRMEIVR